MIINTQNRKPIVETKELKIFGKRRKVSLQKAEFSQGIGEPEKVVLEFYIVPLKGRRKKSNNKNVAQKYLTEDGDYSYQD